MVVNVMKFVLAALLCFHALAQNETVAPIRTFEYARPSSTFFLFINEPISLVPTIDAPVTSVVIDLALPTGLSLNRSTGIISGTPVVASPYTALNIFTLRASNAVSSLRAQVRIIVLPVTARFPQPNLMLRVGESVSQTIIHGPYTSTVRPYAFTVTVSPPLPAGLSINPKTGLMTGSVRAMRPTSYHTVTVTMDGIYNTIDNLSPSISSVLTVSSLGVSGCSFRYNQMSAVSYIGSENGLHISPVMDPLRPLTNFTVTPALPSGLSLDFRTGEISGTGAVVSTVKTYSISARRVGSPLPCIAAAALGSQDPMTEPGNLSYYFSTYPLKVRVPIATWPMANFILNEGGPFGYFEEPVNMPPGLTLDMTSGDITGTPTATGTYQVSVTGVREFVDDSDPLNPFYVSKRYPVSLTIVVRA